MTTESANRKEWINGEHTNYVSSIISGEKGVCSNIPLYCAIGKNEALDFNHLQWMTEYGVQIVNRSFHSNLKVLDDINVLANRYNEFAKNNLRAFVASSGNINQKSQMINVPGCCDNVITVGATDIEGFVLENYSRYKTFNSEQAKPNLVAPGSMEIPYDGVQVFGTSFFAPIVTSAIAVLMKENPDLQSKPWRIPALLQVSANLKRFKHASLYGNQNNFGFDDAYGSGLLDYKEALDNIDNIQDFVFDVKKGLTQMEPRKLTLNKTGNIKISAFWYVSCSGGNSQEVIPDCYVTLCKEDGSCIARSIGSTTNTVLVEANNIAPGDYYIRVERGRFHKTDNIDVGAVAWRIN